MAAAAQQRTNTGWLEPLERPTLAALASRMPARITPDILTGIGFAGSLIIFAAYALASQDSRWLWIASAGLVLNWFGDSLDGTLARYRKIERPRYGYFLDNAIDLVMQFLLAAGIAISGFIRPDLSFVALSVFLMMSVLSLLRANISGVFQLSYGGIGPTEMRAMFILLNAVMYFFPPRPLSLFGLEMTYPNWLSLTWSSVALATFVFSMLSDLRRLAVEDPPRLRER
jgi:phosphatidylglycerophosphate synthase